MHFEIINFLVDNLKYFCIPFGIFLRYLGAFLENRRKDTHGKHGEDLMTKNYEHMLELHERNNHAMEERTQTLIKNAALRKENKQLKGQNESLLLVIATQKQHIVDLELKLKS